MTDANDDPSPRQSSLSAAQPRLLHTGQQPFRIVGIGASAGGLEAFEQVFKNATAESGMAYVLVQHLDPEHVSLLSEILQHSTTMPVVEAKDQMKVAPNCVYVIPPNRDMTIHGGKLQVTLPERPHGQRMAIDHFLLSLAEDQKEQAVGIILSGTGTDGTVGLTAICQAGGLTLVQEPSGAKFDGMPNHAIASVDVSRILHPQQIIGELILMRDERQPIHDVVTLPALTATSIDHILMLLRSATGHDFSQYKKSTIRRRTERCMSMRDIQDIDEYARYLKEHPAEMQIFLKELLINVTSFFRDPEAFITLEKEILPQLFLDKQEGATFRVWVTGCASGEEAYSIAILLREYMDHAQREFRIQLYATDLDDDAIATARAGVYPERIAQHVGTERLSRYFLKEPDGYRIKKEIRNMVVFAVQNLIKDPPLIKLDLLCCRNLMIYLEPELQNKVIPIFHYALRPGGILFLSPAESIGNHADLFTVINRKYKFYLAINTRRSLRTILTPDTAWTMNKGIKVSTDDIKKNKEPNYSEVARRSLLQFYAPATIITDLKGTILFVYGETGRYLRPAPGHASLNIIDMAREGLASELRAAIHGSALTGGQMLSKDILIKTNEDYQSVNLKVRHIPGLEAEETLCMISFNEHSLTPGSTETPVLAHLSAQAPLTAQSDSQPQTADHQRIIALEQDLLKTRENLKATIADQQDSNEELKSTNEELQSTNEELQSTNEELETSKEELQSMNEELVTVNAELQVKIEQLAGMQNDMKNLLDNLNIGTIFLDRKLLIRRFTREATRVFRLVASDVGRPLADIKSDFRDEDFLERAKVVLTTLTPFEIELSTQSGLWYLVHIQPYQTLENITEGVVMTFTDITSRVKAENTIQDAKILAEGIVDTVLEPLIVLDADLKVVSASRSFYRFFQVEPENTIGRLIYDLGNRQWNIPALRELLETILPEHQSFEGYKVEHTFQNIGEQKMLLNARRIINKSGNTQLILFAMQQENVAVS